MATSLVLVGLAKAIQPVWSAQGPFWFDLVVIGYLRGLASPLLTAVMLMVTWVGSAIGLLIFTLLAAGSLYRRGHRLEAGILVLALLVGLVLDALLKEVSRRPRPELLPHLVAAGGYAFPSGHSMGTVSVYGTLVLIVWHLSRRRWLRAAAATASAAVVLAVGLSRVYLGVHWPTDVLGGYLAGLIWVMANHRVLTSLAGAAP